ncbi:MAG: glutathione S-transferase family protein [Rubrivivax sp.]|nr:glutathione S-transferase family protein [Rubrivivax sp.]
MLKVLGRATSINVRKVLWLCEELGLPLEREDWGTPERPTSDAAFLAINPHGLVPVIRDGEFVLRESNTICRYLAAAHGRTDLLPADPRGRAGVEQWMDWQATELNNAWRPAFMGLVRRHPAWQDAAAIAAGIEAWNAQMRLLDAQLARTGAWVTGGTFTLADIVLGLAINRWRLTPFDKPVLAAVQACEQRLAPRPGWRLHGANGMP